MTSKSSISEAVPTAKSADTLADYIERSLRDYFKAHGEALPPQGLYERILKQVEKPLLSVSLEAVSGNQLKAASLLGLNRNTLRKKMRDLKITKRKRKSIFHHEANDNDRT